MIVYKVKVNNTENYKYLDMDDIYEVDTELYINVKYIDKHFGMVKFYISLQSVLIKEIMKWRFITIKYCLIIVNLQALRGDF